MIAAIRGPYCTGACRALRRARPWLRCTATALPLDQLVLSHSHRHRRQVEDLAALHPGDGSARQARPANSAESAAPPAQRCCEPHETCSNADPQKLLFRCSA